MNNVVVRNNNYGINLFGLLGVLFIALKLTGVIDWSWWLVLLPLYGGAAIVLTIFAVVFLWIFVDETIKAKKSKKRG